MPILLLNLRDVPDDEADDVRALLDAHAIDWYETQPSRWGISGGGIWIRHEAQAETARAHLAAYQHERAEHARAQHDADLRDGRVETLWQRIQHRPLQSLLALAGMLLMLLLGIVLLPLMLMR